MLLLSNKCFDWLNMLVKSLGSPPDDTPATRIPNLKPKFLVSRDFQRQFIDITNVYIV